MKHALSSSDISIFRQKIAHFVKLGNTDKNFVLIIIICHFFDCYQVFQCCFDQRDCNFDDVSTIVNPGPLKTVVF